MKAIVLLMLPLSSISQSFVLPDTTNLTESISKYYYEQSIIQIDELQQTRKLKWLAYVPVPGYSPFTGGVTLSINLNGPLQEVRANRALINKIEAIERMNSKASRELKETVITDFYAVLSDIEEYNSKIVLDSLKLQSYNLTTALYNRNELTPSEFLVASQTYESWRVQRLAELLAIRKQINQIRLKAKMPAVSTIGHFVTYP